MELTSKQRLALAVCDFLSASRSDGTVSSDDGDSIEVAVGCIAEAFKVDPADKAAISEAVGDQNLLKIYGVYEKLRKSPKPAASTAAESATAKSASSPSSTPVVTEEAKKEAEALKSRGNAAMAQKDYATAIDYYTKALAITPGNAIYLSNRAAAHSAAKDHQSAQADAEAAVVIDPHYTKAWSRLGLAKFALGDAKGSMEAYKKGIDYEGNGGSEAMKKGYETAKKRMEELQAVEESASTGSRDATGASGTPNLSDLASMFGGGGAGGAGAGGMPDLSSIMSNPMFASMAQNLMSNPDLMSNLMGNPRLREMANQFGSGGGLPDISALMSDPNIADMARSMMGGSGRSAGSGPSE